MFHPVVKNDKGFCTACALKSWSPAVNVERVLLSFHNVLANPTADFSFSCADDKIIKLVQQDFPAYAKKAREWTRAYAHECTYRGAENVKPAVRESALSVSADSESATETDPSLPNLLDHQAADPTDEEQDVPNETDAGQTALASTTSTTTTTTTVAETSVGGGVSATLAPRAPVLAMQLDIDQELALALAELSN
eukprot:m.85288 g.85288  ORF g.85288 m.85288 type:complete len:195 (+) comp50868_c0_seq2:413-997(+)